MKIAVKLSYIGVATKTYLAKADEKGVRVEKVSNTAKFVDEDTNEIFEFYMSSVEGLFVGLEKYQPCEVVFNVEPYQGNINVRLGTVTAVKLKGAK